MTFEAFWEEHTKIVSEHAVCYVLDCDLWSVATGYIYYNLEDTDDLTAAESIAHITGVHYTRDGTALEGDFEGYLELLKTALTEAKAGVEKG